MDMRLRGGKIEFSRRRFTFQSGAILAGMTMNPWHAVTQDPPATRTRLILLGTGGGPRPRKNSFASSQVILINNQAYVVDCGDGVATQLARADVPLPTLRHVFITHHHSDHNADYGNLLLLAWTSGLKTRVGRYMGAGASDSDDAAVFRTERLRHQDAYC